MKKPVKKITAKKPDVALNRWCIEMALGWPVNHQNPTYVPSMSGAVSGMGYTGGQYLQGVHADEDVIGRAKKIRDWVTGGV